MASYRLDYRQHKGNAKRRGIDFFLTYEEWLAIWQASGKLSQRGRGKFKYVMARLDDMGPYAVGNVKIITFSENARQQWVNAATRHKHCESVRGEKHHKATLTNAAVKEIKTALNRNVGRHALAERYGVSYLTVYRISTGHTWRHI